MVKNKRCMIDKMYEKAPCSLGKSEEADTTLNHESVMMDNENYCSKIQETETGENL